MRDLDDEAPWAMQLVVRAERPPDLPTFTDACAAAATAVARLLTDERAAGEWEPEIRRWEDGRIRKICRRARGREWERAQELPGVTAAVGTAEARAFVPGPTDDVPKDLKKLQVQGLDLEPPTPSTLDPATIAPAIVVRLTPRYDLGAGKAAAAAGHAAQLALRRMPPDRRADWAAAGYPARVVIAPPATWENAVESAGVVVHDGGFTVVPPGTITALADWS